MKFLKVIPYLAGEYWNRDENMEFIDQQIAEMTKAVVKDYDLCCPVYEYSVK